MSADIVKIPDLPDLDDLIRVCKSIAMLDAILSPEWEYRYYSFNSRWATGQQMASMRDGSGDSYFILFGKEGAILKGYAHESSAARWSVEQGQAIRGIFEGVPDVFSDFLTEPAFSIEDTTFCYWRRASDAHWQSGHPLYPPSPDPGGAFELLAMLRADPNVYVEWAKNYYEVPVDLPRVHSIYRHEPLSTEIVERLNPAISLPELITDTNEIAYPLASP